MTSAPTGSPAFIDDVETTEVTIMQQILASDTGALSLPELLARGDRTEPELIDYVSLLESHDPPLVTTLEPEGTPPLNHPQQYFAVTEEGIEWLKQHNLYDQVGMIYQIYGTADLSLPDDHPLSIKDLEESDHRPAPDWLN